jgi:hypothetical protein
MHEIIDKKFYLGPKFDTLFNKKWITISELLQFHKKGIWVIHITQPGRETELKTEKIKFKTFHTDKKVSAHLLMQELIARLCGRHFSEL